MNMNNVTSIINTYPRRARKPAGELLCVVELPFSACIDIESVCDGVDAAVRQPHSKALELYVPNDAYGGAMAHSLAGEVAALLGASVLLRVGGQPAISVGAR
jgi:hypothetical protein